MSVIINGILSVRTVTGRNGDFVVGSLMSELGEFAVKDPLLEQLDKGQYEGTFVVSRIYPSSYVARGRVVTEVRVVLDDMTVNQVGDKPTPEESEPDPASEQQPPKASAAEPPAPAAKEPPKAAPTSTEKGVATAKSEESEEGTGDQELFGLLWPLEAAVKLDATVDRLLLRQQSKRLKELGYKYDGQAREWNLVTD